jgi:hypothetical protein
MKRRTSALPGPFGVNDAMGAVVTGWRSPPSDAAVVHGTEDIYSPVPRYLTTSMRHLMFCNLSLINPPDPFTRFTIQSTW